MRPSLFLDANVLFTAAHNPGGYSRALFSLAEAGFCALFTSAFAAEEARRNLLRKTPGRNPDWNRLIPLVSLGPEPPPALLERLGGTGLPDKDLPILAAAVASRCDGLVTGDRRHFGPLLDREVHGVQVLTPRAAFHAIVDRAAGRGNP
ncbi:PIN domain-containing protein [Deferrisoma sp.]